MSEGRLTDIEVHTVTENVEVPSAGWFRDQMTSISPAGQALLDRLPENARQGVLEQTAVVLREQFGDRPIRLLAEAHLAVASAAG